MANMAETLGKAPLAAQIVWTANITGTQGAAPVVKEATEDTVRASQIVGACHSSRDSGTSSGSVGHSYEDSRSSGETKAAEWDGIVEETAQTVAAEYIKDLIKTTLEM